ncbi:hypothetical protein DFH27DRAFT_92901 [Peziza echinospora]|nr:hypothetical protein DFH27DRAFT_92901 [Peziza echinospora]
MPKRLLLEAAKSLCDAFAQGKPVEELLAHFTEFEPVAIEHGHPSLAPFLGREFIGRKKVQKYFELVASLVSFENMQFGDLYVDDDNYRVTVTGTAKWTYKETGKSWEETFIYALDYVEGIADAKGGEIEIKLQRYAVWADTGALYLASRGEQLLQ